MHRERGKFMVVEPARKSCLSSSVKPSGFTDAIEPCALAQSPMMLLVFGGISGWYKMTSNMMPQAETMQPLSDYFSVKI